MKEGGNVQWVRNKEKARKGKYMKGEIEQTIQGVIEELEVMEWAKGEEREKERGVGKISERRDRAGKIGSDRRG